MERLLTFNVKCDIVRVATILFCTDLTLVNTVVRQPDIANDEIPVVAPRFVVDGHSFVGHEPIASDRQRMLLVQLPPGNLENKEVTPAVMT